MKKHFLLLALAAICSLSVWAEVPNVTNLAVDYTNDKVNLSWTNVNLIDLDANEWSAVYNGTYTKNDDGSVTINAASVGWTSNRNGAQVNFNSISGVNSFEFDYKGTIVHASLTEDGGLLPLSVNGTNMWWQQYYKTSPDSWTHVVHTPTTSLGSSSGFTGTCNGFAWVVEDGNSGQCNFTVKNLVVNTTNNTSIFNEVVVIRKAGSAPSSPADGTKVSASAFKGNTLADNFTPDGGVTYYYTIFVYDGTNYSTGTTISILPIPTEPVSPTITFNNGSYYVGASGLDLSTLFKSDSKGTVTYTVKNANGTGATISGSTFTATTAGTATVTATQEAEGLYLEGSADATITVSELPYANGETYFAALAQSAPNIKKTLDDNNYVMSSLENVSWDWQGLDADDTGLKVENAVRTFSFWVKDNHKVTIQVGTLAGGQTPNIAILSRYDIDGNLIKDSTINQNTTSICTTTGSTKFVLTTQEKKSDNIYNVAWSLLKKINIEALAYTLTLKAGEGATGDDIVEKLKENETYILNVPEGFSKDGYHLKEWSDGTTTYAAGATFTMPAKNVTMTAIWEENSEVEYTVEYANGDGNWTGDAPTEVNHKAGETFKLPASTVVTRTGYQFAGWNDGTTTFAAEATYTMPSDNVILTAQWNKLYTVTYAKGSVDYSGTLPTQDPQIEGASFKVAAGIKCQGYAFKGWKAETTTYQPNDDFTMPASAVEFVAQWEAVTVPVVSNLQIVGAENNKVPLSFTIPGIVDLSKYTLPLAQHSTTYVTDVSNYTYSAEKDEITITGNAPQYGQFGVAFPVNVYNLNTITYEYLASSLNGDVNIWCGAISDEPKAYWEFADPMVTDRSAGWHSKTITPTQPYWGADDGGSPIPNPITQHIQQIGLFINYGNPTSQTASFRNVRYHVKDAVDVDHVVITRRLSTEGEDAAVQLYSGTKSAFTDNTITVAGTYVYTVYCEDKDGNRSAGATINYEYAPATAYSVTYTIGDDVTGNVPTEPDHIANAIFKVKAGTNLKRQGYTFAGWNDGEKTYQVGDDYIMPDEAVTFSAQWEEKIVSPVSNFTATGIHKDVTLTWQMPATSKRLPVDLSNARVKYVNQSTLTITKAETNLAECSYNINTGWGYIGFDFPLGKTVSNFESVSFDYLNDGVNAGGNVILYLYGAKGDSRWYDGNSSNLDNNTWTTISATPNQTLRSSEQYAHTIDAVGLEINKANIGNGTASVKNVILTLSEGEWIEGMKLLRKAGSAPTGPTDADATEISLEGLALTCADVLPITQTEVTYHYALYTYDEEENYSVAATASYTFVPQQEYTVTYAAGGEDVIGEVPVDEMPKVEGTKFNLPALGSLQKPYCPFAGWNDGTDTYTAGQEYTMPAKNVIFTAQWGAEEQGLRIPENTVRLNYANKAETSTDLGAYSWNDEQCIDLGQGSQSNLHADWNVYVTPGLYTMKVLYYVPAWNTKYNLSITDPATGVDIITKQGTLSNQQSAPASKEDVYELDLTSLVQGKRYAIRIQEAWTGSQLKVAHIDFIPTITIDQDKEDNLIFNGKANVTLIRPLVGGMTNSICLPFNLNREQINTAFGTDAEVWALTSSTLSPDNMTLNIEFAEVDEMAAGVPYLIQPGEGYNSAVNPIFEEIEMSTTLAPVVQDNLDFIGTVQKSFVSVGYKDHLFVGAGNMVYYPSGSGDLNGMRSYFKIKYHPDVEVPAGVSARMILGKTTPTELRTLKVNDSVRKVMIRGRLYIIRNGVTNDILGNTVK